MCSLTKWPNTVSKRLSGLKRVGVSQGPTAKLPASPAQQETLAPISVPRHTSAMNTHTDGRLRPPFGFVCLFALVI